MSPNRNWDSPTPSPASECAPPPPGTKGGGDTTEPVFVNVYGAQESILPACVAWRASTTNRVSYRPARLRIDTWSP